MGDKRKLNLKQIESKMKAPKPRCYNCKHSGKTFKLGDTTHQHCQHPTYTKEMFEIGELTAWDTLMKFSDTCKNHEFKTQKQGYSQP